MAFVRGPSMELLHGREKKRKKNTPRRVGERGKRHVHDPRTSEK